MLKRQVQNHTKNMPIPQNPYRLRLLMRNPSMPTMPETSQRLMPTSTPPTKNHPITPTLIHQPNNIQTSPNHHLQTVSPDPVLQSSYQFYLPAQDLLTHTMHRHRVIWRPSDTAGLQTTIKPRTASRIMGLMRKCLQQDKVLF